MATKSKGEIINNVDGASAVSAPYMVDITIRGIADILFHRWSVDGVEAKARAAKGSKEKKRDDIESYVYRNDKRELCLPGEYVRQSIIHAAKFRQDPRSPRKSAMDLFKAGVVALTPLASLGSKEWDYVDRRRVVVQRNGITRERPACREGWQASMRVLVTLPEYITESLLAEVLADAGRVVGVADNRPTYGRFVVVNFQRVGLADAAE